MDDRERDRDRDLGIPEEPMEVSDMTMGADQLPVSVMQEVIGHLETIQFTGPAKDADADVSGMIRRAARLRVRRVTPVLKSRFDENRRQHLRNEYSRVMRIHDYPSAQELLKELRGMRDDDFGIKLEHGRLLLMNGDHAEALTLFHELGQVYMNLSPQQISESFLYFLKSMLFRIRVLLPEDIKKLMEAWDSLREEIEADQNIDLSFDDLIEIKAFVEIFYKALETAGGEESPEKVYETAVHYAKNQMDALTDPRLEAFKERLLGTLYYLQAGVQTKVEIDEFRSLPPQEKTDMRKRKLKYLQEARTRIQKSAVLLFASAGEKLQIQEELDFPRVEDRHLEIEGGELLYLLYNLAKIEVARATLNPGIPLLITRAMNVITRVQYLAGRAKNRKQLGFAKILAGELTRFGGHEKPTEQDLRIVMSENERVLKDAKREGDAVDVELALPVLINCAELLIELEGTLKAKPLIQQAVDTFAARANPFLTALHLQNLQSLLQES